MLSESTYLEPFWRYNQISAIASACTTATMSHHFSTPSYRPYRAVRYASLGLAAFVFIFHGIWIYGFSIQNQRMSLSWMAWMGTFNVVGAVVYAARVSLSFFCSFWQNKVNGCVLQIPERWWPYRFDFVGQSHQIFHVMVVIAGLIHFVGLLEAFILIRGEENFCWGWGCGWEVDIGGEWVWKLGKALARLVSLRW